MGIKEKFAYHSGLLLVLSLAVIFLFVNLGDIALWQDEAETALLGRSILRNGIPKAWDGKNLISSLNGADFDKDFVWTWHPWAQAYLTALSFSIFGESNFSARLPFALAGFFTIFFLYLSALRITRDEKTALLSSFLLTVSLQYILYSRQCRYYSLLGLFSVLIFYSCFRLPEKKGMMMLVFSSVLLFHSNFLPFFPTFFGVLIYLVIFERNTGKIKSFFLCAVIIGFLTAPWLIYAKGFSGGLRVLKEGKGVSFLGQEIELLKIINENVFPLVFIPLAVYFLFKRNTAHKKVYQLLLILIFINLLFLPYISYTQKIIGMRYSAGLIPFFSLLSALLIVDILKYKRLLGYFVFIILISTNIFNDFPVFVLKGVSFAFGGFNREIILKSEIGKTIFFKKKYFDFIYELTHHYEGPVDGIVKFLGQRGKSGDLVLTNYESAPIIFYTTCKVAYVISNESEFYKSIPSKRYNPVLEEKLPDYVYSLKKVDWIIPRSNYINRLFNPAVVLGRMEKEGYNIKKYELNYPDLPWNNRADIRYHRFKTAKDYPKIAVYKIEK